VGRCRPPLGARQAAKAAAGGGRIGATAAPCADRSGSGSGRARPQWRCQSGPRPRPPSCRAWDCRWCHR